MEKIRFSPIQQISHRAAFLFHSGKTRMAIASARLFHRFHGPYYYYYPSFLFLHPKTKSQPKQPAQTVCGQLPIKRRRQSNLSPAKAAVRKLCRSHPDNPHRPKKNAGRITAADKRKALSAKPPFPQHRGGQPDRQKTPPARNRRHRRQQMYKPELKCNNIPYRRGIAPPLRPTLLQEKRFPHEIRM